MVKDIDIIRPIQSYYDRSHKFKDFNKDKEKIKKYQEKEKTQKDTGKIIDLIV